MLRLLKWFAYFPNALCTTQKGTGEKLTLNSFCVHQDVPATLLAHLRCFILGNVAFGAGEIRHAKLPKEEMLAFGLYCD